MTYMKFMRMKESAVPENNIQRGNKIAVPSSKCRAKTEQKKCSIKAKSESQGEWDEVNR